MDINIKKIYQPILKSSYRYLLYYGGRGGGKSWGIADTLIVLAITKTVRILCTREILETISDSVHSLLCDRIKAYNLESYFKITQNGIECLKTGSEFKYKGLNDLRTGAEQNVKSFEGADILWIEEGQTVSKKSLKVLFPTIRKPGSKIIVSWNPITKKDAVWDLVANPKKNTLIKKINYYDNDHCPQELIDEAEDCKKYHPNDYNNIWLGEPLELSRALVVKNFTIDNIKNIKYHPSEAIYLCCDFNVDPMMWVLAHKTDDNIYFFDEIVVENTHTAECVDVFLDRYPSHYGQIIVCGDASGDYRKTSTNFSDYAVIKNKLIDAGFNPEINIRHFNPPIRNRIKAFNDKVYGRQGERRLFVDKKCKHLINNIETLSYKEGTTVLDLPTHHQITKDTSKKFLGHIFDAASYPVEYYWAVLPEHFEKFEEEKLSVQESFERQRQ